MSCPPNAIGQLALTCLQEWLSSANRIVNIYGLSSTLKVLESAEAVRYLENNEQPNFYHALQLAIDESEYVQLLSEAAANVKLAMSGIHRYKDSTEIQRAVENLVVDYKELLDRSLSTKTNS